MIDFNVIVKKQDGSSVNYEGTATDNIVVSNCINAGSGEITIDVNCDPFNCDMIDVGDVLEIHKTDCCGTEQVYCGVIEKIKGFCRGEQSGKTITAYGLVSIFKKLQNPEVSIIDTENIIPLEDALEAVFLRYNNNDYKCWNDKCKIKEVIKEDLDFSYRFSNSDFTTNNGGSVYTSTLFDQVQSLIDYLPQKGYWVIDGDGTVRIGTIKENPDCFIDMNCDVIEAESEIDGTQVANKIVVKAQQVVTNSTPVPIGIQPEQTPYDPNSGADLPCPVQEGEQVYITSSGFVDGIYYEEGTTLTANFFVRCPVLWNFPLQGGFPCPANAGEVYLMTVDATFIDSNTGQTVQINAGEYWIPQIEIKSVSCPLQSIVVEDPDTQELVPIFGIFPNYTSMFTVNGATNNFITTESNEVVTLTYCNQDSIDKYCERFKFIDLSGNDLFTAERKAESYRDANAEPTRQVSLVLKHNENTCKIKAGMTVQLTGIPNCQNIYPEKFLIECVEYDRNAIRISTRNLRQELVNELKEITN